MFLFEVGAHCVAYTNGHVEYPIFFFFCHFYYRNDRERTRNFTRIFETSADKVLKKTICYQCYLCVKIALIAKGVFFKTLSRSIYKSCMIKGSGQGVLKRKNY